jgi:hypothetical protein
VCQVSFTPKSNPDLVVESKLHARGTVSFSRATWRDLPTMCHVVNALAALPVRGWGLSSIEITLGGKPYLDQRILD